MARTFCDIIELWKRRADFAKAVGVTPLVASAWWQRDSIPAGYFTAVVDAAKAAGHEHVTADLLAKLAARRRPRSAA